MLQVRRCRDLSPTIGNLSVRIQFLQRRNSMKSKRTLDNAGEKNERAEGPSMIDGDGKTGASTPPEPISSNLGATIIGPRNPAREAENPDTLVPPRVDHGTMANLRWSFADSHMHLSEGGWGRQTTARE